MLLLPPLRFFCLCLLLLLSCSNSLPIEITARLQGKVIGVKDGDTIEILTEGNPLTIRLAHIDCPETRKQQPFGRTAKQFTSDYCFGQQVVVVHQNKYDRYKRLIGEVINSKGQNLNKELVNAGLAWHFKKYSSDYHYAVIELKARNAKKGLWADKNPTPPWLWRKPR